MNIGSTSNDIGIIIIGLLLVLFVPILLLFIGKLIGMIFGVRSGGFPLVFLVVISIGAILGGSLYMDTSGRTIQGHVLAKQESVRLREEGDWRYDWTADVRYRLDGAQPNPDYTEPDDSAVRLKLWAPAFDALRVGDTPQLKVLPLWRSITLVRLANTSTRDWIPWNWIGIGASILVLGWLAFKAIRSRRRLLVAPVVALAAVALVAVPSLVIYRQWRAMEDLTAKPLRATATIENVTRVTRIDPLPCGGSCRSELDTSFDVPQQYDIVQMRFTPQGARDSVLAVDASDADAVQIQGRESLQVAYAANDPRAVQIIGATHSHHWKNMIGFVGLELMGWIVLGVLWAGGYWLAERFKRRLGQVRSGVR